MTPSPWSQRPYWAALIAPLALYLVVFLVIPFINIIILSFYTLFADTYLDHRAHDRQLRRSAGCVVHDGAAAHAAAGPVCTVICVLFGYPLAYFLARASRRVALIGLFFLVMPLMVSAVIRTFGWLVILGRNGLVNSAIDGVRARPPASALQ